MIKIVLGVIFLWILLGIILPFLLFPNYLQRPRIKTTKKIKNFANKLKNKDPQKTLENVYRFVVKNHYEIAKSKVSKISYFGMLFHNDVEKEQEIVRKEVQNILDGKSIQFDKNNPNT